MATAVHRCLMLGAGGMARNWLGRFLSPFADRLAVAGLVEIVPETLHRAADALGLPAHARFADMEAAFRALDAGAVAADCCIVVCRRASIGSRSKPPPRAGWRSSARSRSPTAGRTPSPSAARRAAPASRCRSSRTTATRRASRRSRACCDSGRLGRLHYWSPASPPTTVSAWPGAPPSATRCATRCWSRAPSTTSTSSAT